MKKFVVLCLAVAFFFMNGMQVQAAEKKSDEIIYPTVEQVAKELACEEGAQFPIGAPNKTYEKYFTGQTFMQPLANNTMNVANVTFLKGAHTFWHKHHGSCQILVTESGVGYYQIWGEQPQKLLPGVVVTIPENVKHWHGAAPNHMMQHVSIMLMGENVTTEWLEEVDPQEFAKLK